MTAATHPRTVRFKGEEIGLIEEFLAKNRFLDFSSMTRIAVLEFIKNPSVQIQPIATKPSRAARPTRSKERLL